MSRVQHLNQTLLPALQFTPKMSTKQQCPWPNGSKAAVSFTMDNLGEAQAVLSNSHPANVPIGQDPAVLTNLPRILDLLATHNIKATYFAESWSLPVYPSAVADLRARGHEVAWHGFQHEVWKSLGEAEEKENFSKSFAAAKEYEVAYAGFRPPGGSINGARTLSLLKEHGCKYVSPLGDFSIDSESGIVVLPFEWEAVDAFWYMDTEKFKSIRAEHGVSKTVLGPGDFKEYLEKRIEDVKREGGYMSILFHPFLTDREERWKVLEETLEIISKDRDLWIAPCDEVAGWVSEHKNQFSFTS
ncbi:hypothetical protein N0V82_006405 [Gnomoniopsis sp. IMI 355080]|nr:hypothetical protein N0V82_006405 [Gnomoniopsis sp. IMI 355080]